MKIKLTACLVAVLLLTVMICACTDEVNSEIPMKPTDESLPPMTEAGSTSESVLHTETDTELQGTVLTTNPGSDGTDSTFGEGSEASTTGGAQSGEKDERYWETFWDGLPKPNDGTKPY